MPADDDAGNSLKRGKTMKNILREVFAVCAVGACLVANAESMIVEVWQCTLNDDKTIEQVHATNAAWLKFANSNVDGGEISSSVVIAVVGQADSFLFVDTFPSMEYWADAKTVMSSEGSEYEAAINETATCTSNNLYESTSS